VGFLLDTPFLGLGPGNRIQYFVSQAFLKQESLVISTD
jgi:hypothetical protein